MWGCCDGEAANGDRGGCEEGATFTACTQDCYPNTGHTNPYPLYSPSDGDALYYKSRYECEYDPSTGQRREAVTGSGYKTWVTSTERPSHAWSGAQNWMGNTNEACGGSVEQPGGGHPCGCYIPESSPGAGNDQLLFKWEGVTCSCTSTDCYNVNDPPQVVSLDLSGNNLQGTLPTELGDLTMLGHGVEGILDLGGVYAFSEFNSLTGSLPTELGRMTKLNLRFSASFNQLSGSIPTQIGRLSKIGAFSGGPVGASFDVSHNKIGGSIPTELGALTKIVSTFLLNHNSITGTIPTEVAKLSDIGASCIVADPPASNCPQYLSGMAFLSNRLCGTIPDTIENMDNYDVRIWENGNFLGDTPCSLTSALADLYSAAGGAGWTSRSNWMIGSPCTGTTADPGEWEKITCVTVGGEIQVQEIDLNGNNLVGSLPTTLGLLTTLTRHLTLGSNKLTGSIPTEIGSLSKLTDLRISYNAFTGAAPKELEQLHNLERVQLHSNRITGTIPLLQVSNVSKSSFISDCGVPSAFEEPLECERCTMCCKFERGLLLSEL